ncbi:MAG: nucleotidyltransferase domain-containing protein [Acidobacteria bacterium]|nr:nucleotidyltransferase domain-containing protein [Acidobacteriota bacterium]
MADTPRENFNLILPIGTQIVSQVEIRSADGRVRHPRGAVGRIIAAPIDGTHSYRVCFADGGESALRRHELRVRKRTQADVLNDKEAVLSEYDLRRHIIYACVVGSRAYGLSTDESDTDRHGIYLPPAEAEWSLYGVPEQLESKETEECYWELKKFLILALKANPNVLECLYTPLVELKTPLAEELLGLRDAFLSQLIYQTYNGYVMSQFKKLEGDLRNRGEIKWKHAMHLIRLLLAGVGVLKEGTLSVNASEHRARLLAIKRGEIVWVEVNAWRLELHKEFDSALRTTRLPERPDHRRANDFLIKARRAAADNTNSMEAMGER